MLEAKNFDFASWPYPMFDNAQQIQVAQDFGLAGLELFPDGKSEELRAANLINGMLLPDYSAQQIAPFSIGLGSAENSWGFVTAETKRLVDLAAANKFPNVIAFTGYGEPTDDARDLCIQRFIEIGKYAESQGVALCLEHLNNRQFDGPNGGMMGHPGYMGHSLPWVGSIVQETQKAGVHSAKLLFDWYHVRIMHPGQEFELFEQFKDVVGHVHVAQHPGRIDIDQAGELHFPDVAETLARANYGALVGIEFIPMAERDPLEGLREALRIMTGK